MKDGERKAWTEFVRQREQASKSKKRERRPKQTPEAPRRKARSTEDALDDLLREAAAKQGARKRRE